MRTAIHLLTLVALTAFATGAHAQSSGNSKPSSETSTPSGSALDPNNVGTAFYATLSGGTFDSRSVREQDAGGDTSSCNTSTMPSSPIRDFFISPRMNRLGTWTVSANKYGNDTIEIPNGYVESAVVYGNPSGCNVVYHQIMQISCSNGTWCSYFNNTLTLTFSGPATGYIDFSNVQGSATRQGTPIK